MGTANFRNEGLLGLVAILCLLLVTPCPVELNAADAPERAEAEAVKAVMTSIILRNTQWPEKAFEDDSVHFRIGIIGKNQPVKEFTTAFEEITISGRAIQIVSLKSPKNAVGMHAVYFSEASPDIIKETLSLLADTPAITFGDHENFYRLGGIVNFRTVDGKLRFQFNRTSMETSGVRVSAQVIRLAIPANKEGEK